MRKAEKKEDKQENQVVDIIADVKINKDTILEKGDKIEILGKGKVEEEKLNEDHLIHLTLPVTNAIVQAYEDQDLAYVDTDLYNLLSAVKDSVVDYPDLYEYMKNLIRKL